MKKNGKVIIMALFFLLCLVFNTICSFAGEGNIDVKVEVPDDFKHSLMINFIDEQGINYLITAEAVNDWKANNSMPEGKYSVDFVSFDIPDENYKVKYQKELIISENKGSKYSIVIEDVKSKTIGNIVEKTGVSTKEPEQIQKESMRYRTCMFIKTIFIKNYVTIMLIIFVVLFLYNNKRRKSKHEKDN